MTSTAPAEQRLTAAVRSPVVCVGEGWGGGRIDRP